MYKLVQNAEVTALKTKFLTKNVTMTRKGKKMHSGYGYISCIGRDHQVIQIQMSDDSNSELTFKNDLDDTYKITIVGSKISFDVVLGKQNRFYDTYVGHCREEFLDENSNNRWSDFKPNTLTGRVSKTIHIWGITIGDLIKHFAKMTNFEHTDDKLDIHSKKTNTDSEENQSIVEEEKAKFKKFVHKVQNIDTYGSNSKNVFGVLDSYRGLYSWDELIRHNNIGGGSDSSFDAFCKRIVYFTDSAIIGLFSTVVNPDGSKDTVIGDKTMESFVNKIVDVHIVKKLYRYFYHKEDPELTTQEDTNPVTPFPEPMSIPDALKFMNDLEPNESLMKFHRLLSKKPNDHQAHIMADKYKPYIIPSLTKISRDFPFYALRNIYVTEWINSSGAGIDSSYFIIDELYDRYMRTGKSYKAKHRVAKSTKTIPYDNRPIFIYRDEWNTFPSTGVSKIKLTEDDYCGLANAEVIEGDEDWAYYEEDYDEEYDEEYEEPTIDEAIESTVVTEEPISDKRSGSETVMSD